ncbi:MAG: phosphotransferase [Burkholderiales bacterium]|nr:phosphotransferase [Burkholderiales bacterium]
METPTSDARRTALAEWMGSTLAPAAFSLAPASEDASFRRYFRVTPADASAPTLIAMDAPPPMEDCRPFVHVASLLHAAGVHAPRIVASDLVRGFLLLEDLGTTTYLEALQSGDPHPLYLDALDSLVRFQATSREGELPPYDEALLRRELDLFPDWYVVRHRGRALDARQREALEGVFAKVLANNLAQPRVFVHRDYHSRNLMAASPNPGVLDFQDAVYGPVTYDLVSLLRDAYIEWDEERQLDWAVRYWEKARAAGLPVDADFGAFWRDFEWMGVQRQVKVLGIFARLAHRDGKARYVEDMPLVMRYLRAACGRYRDLSPLLVLLDALDDREPVVGYTF